MTSFNVLSRSSMIAGQPEDISVVLANFDAIAAILNGGLDNGNIAAGAAILASKLAGYPGDVTKSLRGDGTWGTSLSPVTRGTVALGPPTSPAPNDGDFWIAVDDLLNPSFQWVFRYNAASTSPYKWEFYGGTPQYSRVDTEEAPASTGWVDLATVGPEFLLPSTFGGDFLVDATCVVASGAGGIQGIEIGAAVNAGVPSIVSLGNHYQGGRTTQVLKANVNGVGANSSLRLRYLAFSTTNLTFGYRQMFVLPKRIG